MKNAMILTAVISAIFAGSACAKTPVKTPEKVVSQTTKITQKDFDKLENMNTADFLKNSKWTPIIKSKIGVDNYKFLLNETSNNDNVLVSSFKKEKDKTNNKLQWYSNDAWYKFSDDEHEDKPHNLICVSINSNNELYIAFLDKNSNINIKRTQVLYRNLPNHFTRCVSELITSYIVEGYEGVYKMRDMIEPGISFEIE